MAKNIEPYEEDFSFEEQNSTEEPLIEEDEDVEDESPLRIKPRPARASLTHNAIKSEILKMNKQYNSQRQDSEDNDENLSRSARKRKKRREKVLEERRASGGRGDNFEDDLAHFKSIPISRRRSSVLPQQTISLPNHNNDEGFFSKLKCFLWILLVVGTLVGLIYVWPTVAELELEIADQANIEQANEDQIQLEVIVNSEIEERADQILDQIDKLSEELTDNQEDQTADEEESLTTFGYLSSFFGSDSPALVDEEQAVEQNEEEEANDNQNNDEHNQNDDVDEQPIEPTPSTADDEQVDEGFEEEAVETNDDEQEEIIVEAENLAQSVPERYQSAVHQEEDIVEEEQSDSCVIGGQLYNNLDNEQCSLLQERHRQLEQQLHEQEQAIRQEQQANNDEQFYFF